MGASRFVETLRESIIGDSRRHRKLYYNGEQTADQDEEFEIARDRVSR
jgi:hypothetical protein